MPIPYYGDIAEDSTLYIPFNTFSSDDPSASITITNLAAGDIHIHKNGSTTQKTTSNGITVSINYDTITGNHLVTIDTSNDTGDAGFWVTGAEYTVRMEGTTVDGATINAWIGAFSIERSGGALAIAKLIQTAVITNAAGVDISADIAVVDSNVDAVLVDTGTSIPADIAALNDPTSAQIADDVWDEILTGATHNIPTSAGRRLRGIQEFQGYENGSIWIDTVNGSAGTVDYENGTVENPVASIADANTLAASLGITRFTVAPGSSITLAASAAGKIFSGASWTLALGGQSIVGSTIIGATVSGIAAGSGTTQYFVNCKMGATSHIAGTTLITCGIAGTQIVVEAGDFFLDRCHSAIAGTATWIWNFGPAIGNTNLNVRNHSGGIQLENMGDTGTDTASIEGRGQIIEGTCTGGTVAVRGSFTISGETNLTFSDDARYDVTQISDNAGASPAQVNAEVLDVMNVDTFGEPGDEAPAETTTIFNKINYLYKFLRNKVETTSTRIHVYDDAGTNKDQSSVISDDGTTFTRAEFGAGD